LLVLELFWVDAHVVQLHFLLPLLVLLALFLPENLILVENLVLLVRDFGGQRMELVLGRFGGKSNETPQLTRVILDFDGNESAFD
jgi:hypothetical protein